MDNRPIKSKNNESGTITALLTSAEVTSAHLSPVPENAPGIFVMNPGTTEEEHIFYKERDAVLGTVSGLVRDIENQNGGVGREAQANAPWETLQSARYLNNIVDMLIEGYLQETNDVAYVSAASFTVKTNRSTFYTKGRVVRFDDGAIAIVSANSTYAAGTGLTTVLVTGTVPSDLATVEIGIQHKGRTDIFASGSDVNTGTDPYKIVTPKALADSDYAKTSDIPTVPNIGGWATLGACTYEGADDPTFTFSIASDVTGILSPGMRIKLTQTTIKYFIVTAVGAFSGGKTIITVYGGTDYDLDNSAITSPYYSTQKAPQGFPLSPLKWTVEVNDVTNRTQATPTSNQWYNLNTTLISVPIGLWKLSYHACLYVACTTVTANNIEATLSTTNNSASDNDLISYAWMSFPSGSYGVMQTVYREKFVSIAAKTSYYMNIMKPGATAADNIGLYNSISANIIRAVCAYL